MQNWKQLTVIDGSDRLSSFLSSALSETTVHFVSPSNLPQVQDHTVPDADAVVLNFSSLEGEWKSQLDLVSRLFINIPIILVVSKLSQHPELTPALISRVRWVRENSPEAIRQVVECVLEQSAGTGSSKQIQQLELRNKTLQKDIQDLLEIGEISRSIGSTLLIEEILTEILKGLRRVLSLDRVLLGLVHTESRIEEVKVAIGVPHESVTEAQWPISEDGLWRRLLEERKPVVIQAGKDSDLPAFILETFGDQELVKAPMVVKGHLVGTIMGARNSRGISKRDIRLLQIFVQYAGIAIENGRLYYDVIQSEDKLKETQQQLVEAERLAVIGQLAVSINHEINNPLCNISLINQILRKELAEKAPEVLRRLDGIDESIGRIQQVTQKVSDIKKANEIEYLPNQMMIDLK